MKLRLATGTTAAYRVEYATAEDIAEGKRRAALYPDPCEWNPTAGRGTYGHEVHAAADVIVGANGKWRLCAACAALPEFKRYRKRTPVRRSA